MTDEELSKTSVDPNIFQCFFKKLQETVFKDNEISLELLTLGFARYAQIVKLLNENDNDITPYVFGIVRLIGKYNVICWIYTKPGNI